MRRGRTCFLGVQLGSSDTSLIGHPYALLCARGDDPRCAEDCPIARKSRPPANPRGSGGPNPASCSPSQMWVQMLLATLHRSILALGFRSRGQIAQTDFGDAWTGLLSTRPIGRLEHVAYWHLHATQCGTADDPRCAKNCARVKEKSATCESSRLQRSESGELQPFSNAGLSGGVGTSTHRLVLELGFQSRG